MAEIGKTGAGHQADIAGANHRYTHQNLPSLEVLIGTQARTGASLCRSLPLARLPRGGKARSLTWPAEKLGLSVYPLSAMPAWLSHVYNGLRPNTAKLS